MYTIIVDFCSYFVGFSDRSCASNGIVLLTLSNGSQVEVYCDMEGSHCDEEGGWTRIAFGNMSVPGSSCPSGLVQQL